MAPALQAMKNLKKWVRKRSKSRPEDALDGVDLEDEPRASEPLAVDVDHSDRFGLKHLVPATSRPDDGEQCPVDIIAVHGLNGDCYTTWTHKNGSLWLRDFLPGSIPGCRVFTYGYPSEVFSDSIAQVKDYSRGLVDSIRDIQGNDSREETRRIILICHSLGGIVCKQALVTAHEKDSIPGNRKLLRSIAGIVFFGTPHRGAGGIVDLAAVVGNIINTFLPTKIRTDHLDFLKPGSKDLQGLADSVVDRLAPLKIVSFYETEPEPTIHSSSLLSQIIVEKASATLLIPGEEIIPLHSTHRDMCRFPDCDDTEFRRVLNAIRGIAAHAAEGPRTGHRTSTNSFQKTWDDLTKACVSLFSRFDVSDYQARLPAPAEGTCRWILGHRLFVSWLERADNALLWLTGHSGCGKTILSFFLAKQLEKPPAPGPPNSVYIFFCDDKISKQKYANNILISLIFQLICRHQSLARHVRRSYQIYGTNLTENRTALWTLFKTIITDPKSGPTIIIIDALDECEQHNRCWLLNAIKTFVGVREYRHHIKFVLTSRPNLTEVESIDDGVSNHRIPIDEDHVDHDRDVRIFIRQRLDEISKQRHFTDDTKEFLLESLYSRSGQTFLWVCLVLEQIETSDMLSRSHIKTFIQGIPQKLEKTYMGFVSSISNLDVAAKLLKLILGASRLLSLDEINIAFSIEASHRTAENVEEDYQMPMHRTLRQVLGPLIRISDSKVSLVHQSAKEFILQHSGTNEELPPKIRTIAPQDCTLAIATACIDYLLLDDFAKSLFGLVDSPVKSRFDSDSDSQDAYETSPAGSVNKPFWENDDEELDLAGLMKEPGALDEDTCQLLASKYPFYSYAALNWTEHFALCEETAPPRLRDAAKTLLNINLGNCANWSRYYSTEITAGVERVPLQGFDSPLTLAAFFNLHGALKDYLERHASPESMPQESITEASLDNALFWGAERGHLRIVTTLLDAGGNPNARQLYDTLYDQTPLIIASKNGHLDCVRALLSHHLTLMNLAGKYGRSALSFACSAGHKEIVQMLLSHPGQQCDTNHADHTGITPLTWAARGGHGNVIALLARHPDARIRVDLNHRDKTGRTAISWAAGEGMDAALKELLKIKGVDVNLPDNVGRTPLSWAAGSGLPWTVKMLLKDRNVDKTTADQRGRNPYSWACERGHAATVEALLRYGCPGVDEPDESGWSPLAWAVQNSSPKTVEALLSAPTWGRSGSAGVDLERRDEAGTTALQWAVIYGHVEVVRTLLRAGADPHSENLVGSSPVSAAREKGRGGILEELLAHPGTGSGAEVD